MMATTTMMKATVISEGVGEVRLGREISPDDCCPFMQGRLLIIYYSLLAVG